MTSLKVDAVRASDVYAAWGNIIEGNKQPVGLAGNDLVDGMALALLKSEWLAASAGVVPFGPLPGGGTGVMTIGGALAEPKNAWPSEEARHLYMLGHRTAASVHASVNALRVNTPMLPITSTVNAPQWPVIDDGTEQTPLVWVVVAAVGILASMATAWYFTRTEETRIQADADKMKEQHAVGVLSDLASAQLQKTGKIDPNIIAAIRTTPSSAFNAWPYVAVGGGAIVVGSFATYKAMTWKKRRR